MRTINSPVIHYLKIGLGLFALYILLERTFHSWNTSVPSVYYFTVLSNLFCCVLWLYTGFTKKKVSAHIHGAVTLYMFITGVVFSVFIHQMFTEGLYTALLAHKISQSAHFTALTCSTFTHYVFPTLIVIDFILFAPKGKLTAISSLKFLIFPVLYCLFHTILGITTGQYLYPFLDPTRLGGWSMVFLSIGLLSIAFILIAKLLFAIKERLYQILF